MAIKKTALMLDQELVKQVQEILGTSHHHRDPHGGAPRGDPRPRPGPRHFERLRRREGMDLDDPEVMKGAWRYLDEHGSGDLPRRQERAGSGAPRRRDAPRRAAVPVGQIATCAMIDLELLYSARDRRRPRGAARSTASSCPACRCDDACFDRADRGAGRAGRSRASIERAHRRPGHRRRRRAGRPHRAALRPRLRPHRRGHRPADGVGRPAGHRPWRDEGPASASRDGPGTSSGCGAASSSSMRTATSLTPARSRCCHGPTSPPGSCRCSSAAGGDLWHHRPRGARRLRHRRARRGRHRALDVPRSPSTTPCSTGPSRCRRGSPAASA